MSLLSPSGAPKACYVHRPVLAIGSIWLITRLVALWGFLSSRAWDPGTAFGLVATNTYDASWYQAIAANGYADPHLGGPVAVFYPGYSLAVAAFYWPARTVGSWLFGADRFGPAASHVLLPAIMLLVSNLALLGALLVLWRLYEPRLGSTSTVLGIGFLLAAPTSFFLSTGYSESLFIVLVAGSFLLAEQERWVEVGLIAAAACLVRFPGALLLFPLAILWFGHGRKSDKPAVLGLGIFGIGAIAYPGWLWITSGDVLAYLHLQQTHRRGLSGPWSALGLMLDQGRNAIRVVRGHPANQRLVDVPTIAANWLALLAGLVTAILGWTRLRAYEVVWVILVLTVPLLTGTGESLDRYWLAAFPIFFFLGRALRRWPLVAGGVMALSSIWLFALSYNFGRLIWVG